MWMVSPECLCDLHLNGEHGEIHKHRGSFVNQHSIKGRYGQIEPLAMKRRHDALAKEMMYRGMNHHSPYEMPDISYLSKRDREGKVDTTVSVALLSLRCMACNERLNDFFRGKLQRRRLLESIRMDFGDLHRLVDPEDIKDTAVELMGAIRSGHQLGLLSPTESRALYRRAWSIAT
jgi:hypothetical protein